MQALLFLFLFFFLFLLWETGSCPSSSYYFTFTTGKNAPLSLTVRIEAQCMQDRTEKGLLKPVANLTTVHIQGGGYFLLLQIGTNF